MAEWKDISCDIETDDLKAKVVWVCVVMDIPTGEHKEFRRPDIGDNSELQEVIDKADRIWGHNFLQFDAPILRKLCNLSIPHEKIVDTLVLSRLGHYNRKGGHSLDALGSSMGINKKVFSNWSELSDEMVEYCVQDCAVQARVAKTFMPMLKMDTWAKSIEIEHWVQAELKVMSDTGFPFDEPKASAMLAEVLQRMGTLEDSFHVSFPPEEQHWKTLKLQKKKDGDYYSNVQLAMNQSSSYKIEGEELVCYHMVDFNPGSAKQRIDRLNEAGWEPFDKTDGHNDHIRGRKRLISMMGKVAYEEKLANYEVYGWKCNEDNLNTLPADAPASAHDLAEWLTLDGRRSSLVEWIGQYNPETGRVHGSISSIGAWTGRCSHSKPNTANIASEFHGEPTTGVERVKATFDGGMRECWTAPSGKVLVGTDADGIQLRILAHLMKSDEYIEAILSGKKEDGTDIHNVNRRALGLEGITRDMAKTFIYAFLLGAGFAKVAEILKTTVPQAKIAVESFTESITGLKELKQGTIPRCAERGYFTGLDGRKVRTPSQHKVLAGMLQNGESVIMKHAMRKWTIDALEAGIDVERHGFVHDEWQSSCSPQFTDQLGQLQRDALVWAGENLDVLCPLAGSTDTGNNWRETH